MRIPGPADVLRLAEQGYRAAERAIELVPRVVDAVGRVEQLVSRADGLLQDAEELLRRAGRTVDAAEQLSSQAAGLLEPFRPALQRMEQIAARIADTTSAAEVDAAVQVITMLPEVVGSLRADILPILNTLDTVAPDLREMLIVSHELNEMLGSIPGLGRAKKRIEDDIEIPAPPGRVAQRGSGPRDAAPAGPSAGQVQRK